MTTLFNLHYHLENCGDGSAALRLHKTKKSAEKADREAEKNDDNFAEPTADSIKLKLEDGILYYKGPGKVVEKKYVETWVKVEVVDK